MVCWEVTRLVWSLESCVAAARWSCTHVVCWKAKAASGLTDVWLQLFKQQNITVICTIDGTVYCVTGPWCRRRSLTADIWRNQIVSWCGLRRVDGSKHSFGSCQAAVLWSYNRLVSSLWLFVTKSYYNYCCSQTHTPLRCCCMNQVARHSHAVRNCGLF